LNLRIGRWFRVGGGRPRRRDRLDPLPEVVHLRRQRRPIAGVVDDPIGRRQPLLARHLPPDPGLRIGLAEPPELHQPLDRHIHRNVDHDDPPGLVPTPLHQERDVQDDHMIGVAQRRRAPQDLPADGWMHDGVEVLQGVGVVEHDRGQRAPIQGTVGGHDTVAEALDQGGEDGGARLLDLPDDDVGVDDDRALGRQQLRDRRLARTDATCESDDDHRARRVAST
jgi:hypothetical protein